MSALAATKADDADPIEWLPPSWGARGVLLLLLLVGGVLRLSGLDWNLEHHSAVGFAGAPTFHVDEADLARGLKDDFRPFNTLSIVMDGPLVSNVAWLGVRILREPGAWDAALPILVGRFTAAFSDWLALLILWLLLRSLRVSTGVALFAVAAITVAPNHVLNAHFARTHTVANLLQLLTMLLTSVALWAATARTRALAFFGASFFAILAGSARYPFLSVGLLPAALIPVFAIRAHRTKTFREEFAQLVPAGLAALLVGGFLGFQLRPVEILGQGLAVQGSLAFQVPWHDVRGIALSALHNLKTISLFPGRVGIWIFLVMGLFALPLELRAKRHTAALFSGLVAGWALFYLVAWGKYAIHWQRYSIAFVMSVVVLGAIGLDRALAVLRPRVPALQSRWAIATAALAAIAVLGSPAFLSGLIALRFNDDAAHPLYRVSSFIAQLPPGPQGPRTMFIETFWSWNRPLEDLVDPARVTLRYVPDLATACAEARPGDLVLDLAFARLHGTCPEGTSAKVLFAATNLGPAGYPYPSGSTTAPWPDRHYEDFHYLFQELELREFERD